MTDQFTAYRLPPTALKRYTDTHALPPDSTHARPAPHHFGQRRAVNAIQTALDIKANGYHVFAVGENGLGKRTLITRLLAERAKHEPTPPDLVYVHNFDAPRHPIALTLPSCQGAIFAKDMHKLWHELYKKIIAKFNSISYQNSITAIKQSAQKQERNLLDEINATAKSHNLTLLHSADQKAVFTPIDDKKPINNTALDKLQKKLTKINIELDNLDDEVNQKIDELHETLLIKIITPLFTPILKKYVAKSDKKISQYLNDYQKDIIENILFIVEHDEDFMVKTANIPNRYYVNVAVSHTPNSGSPIVFEDMPTHPNLLGHIEYITQLGTILTDASMIRAGALHKANGGYLLLEASSLLEHPYAWQGLKRALQSKSLSISSLEQMLTLTGSVSLSPDSTPLSVKVILLGEPDLYYELLEFEPEFNNLFKIRADFNDTLPRNHDSELFIIGKIADMIKKQDLPIFDNTAFGAILDELSVYADDKDKLDLHSDRLLQLVVESARQFYYHSHENDNKNILKTVNKTHVQNALDDIKERKGYLKELYWQEIQNGQQLINTTGKAVGQINALTVIAYADSEFGLPARLTALIAPKFGTGEILDIERDVELGGSLHAKGMLIMTSFLRSLFSQFVELNFSASLAFEQSYAHIDGDSATLAECAVLLSALANVPINQSLAITGSMNQLGDAQAIGGVNEKIIGFFDACFERGLTGEQGVIIPKTNIGQLMLPDNVVGAVERGKFHIYAVSSIYEALFILTDMSIHDKNKKGDYKKDTLFGKIVRRLMAWEDDDNGVKK
ncbi:MULTISPECIES: ATP-binding protein [Moraxella]|uniref:endopeptidase La n=1 Tax=Moraxella lacunata TaxID=477 RepID=A0A1B8PWD0_MORLA|nr:MULTISPECIES: ATP-binding protein [Moraxella]MBE9578093.1 AAA family ATPase [Moraxella sp. K1664]MBE9587571.1 AAA family ATPase [Moraxella sp. K1630]MBE9595769.1 AAA family ATPase [Moraxella sp. K2450]MDI4482596.1 ATP-binding protein [Moraxella lacunata]MDI4506973.1 ATP-binding protein [Moraxella lacunata]